MCAQSETFCTQFGANFVTTSVNDKSFLTMNPEKPISGKPLTQLVDELRRELAESKRANDELFRIKQKVVIANRELMTQNANLRRRLGEKVD